MAHFAKVIDNVVQQVIVAEQDFIDKLPDKDKWIQTSYNTHNGKHYAPNSNDEDGGTAIRGNYAGIGMKYNSEKDYFYYTRPFDKYGDECLSWTFKEEDFTWHAPTDQPIVEGKGYTWKESTRSWVEIPISLPDSD
jgi:hypothetical protein